MDPNKGFEALKQSLQKFSTIPEAELSFLHGCLEFVSISAKTILIEQGILPTRFYFIYKGLLKQHFLKADGKEFAKTFLCENQLCANYSSILTHCPANFETTALEDCELIAINTDKIPIFYQRHACWQTIGRKIAEETLVAKELREYQMLALSAEERYRQFQQHFGHLLNRLPQYEIASYIGITPVALSQIRQKNSKAGKK